MIKNMFGIHSFSALSRAHASVPFERADLGNRDRYDHFIFQELGRGANVGTALHSIFERLDFSKPDSWEQTLTEASRYYPNIIKSKDENGNGTGDLEFFKQLVTQVMDVEMADVDNGFSLSQVAKERKLPEMEFFFSLGKAKKTGINEILGEEADLAGEADIEGLMTGFIDLVFEHNGKFYILDWKSNHLGNSMGDYDRAGLEKAMKESNYNLQYMIYTVAVKRWLENRISDFKYDEHFGGVIYIFLRGIRADNSNRGIFFTRPDKSLVDRLEALITA
jgi:exodeoxyribonuclease V beta subunit